MPQPINTRRPPRALHLVDMQLPDKLVDACIFVRRFALPIIVGFGVVSIISASYVGLNGRHVWRQSDSYSQILGMLGQPGLGPLDNFQGQPLMLDVPVYQAIIAALATVTDGEPLLIVRIFGAALFIVFAFAGARIAETLRPGSGLVFAALLATSPLYLGYFATPLPDVFSLACSVVAVMLLVTSGNSARYWLAMSLLVVAALIKSPVPFVLLAFYVTWLLLNWRSRLSSRRSWLGISGLLVATLLSALTADLIRRHISQRGGWVEETFTSRWYFGLPSDRISMNTWKAAWNYTSASFAFSWLAFAAVIALVIYLNVRRFEGFKLLVPLFVGFASGWLIFTNVYVIHDYYGMPTTFMMLMAVSIALREIAGLIPVGIDLLTHVAVVVLIVAVPLMIVYGDKTSSYGVTSAGQTMRFILRDVEQFLYVSDERRESPSVGGLTAKPFTKISSVEFEYFCTEVLQRVQAVVVLRWMAEDMSQCSATLRESAVSFMRAPYPWNARGYYEVFLLGG